ncbi:MAG: glycosyltransferase [Acidobacteriota bacterium]|nr:glycosyltransferase [Acidobacteriota bacterium]
MSATGISVIIPTHNRRETLVRAVESVQAQTFRDWDLLIVDDGSHDGTDREWSNPGDPRIRYLRTEHRGVSAARNLGIQQARFPWIAFLDSDDTWLPKKLEAQLTALESHPGYLAVHSDEIWIRRGRRVNPKKIHRKYGGWVYRYSLPRCVISPSSILIARELLDRCGMFDEDFPVCEDYELWLRMFARHPICFVDRPLLVKTGGHADQLSRSTWGLDRFRVRAMVKTVESGVLSLQQEAWTAAEIARKSDILAGGSEKRGRTETGRYYRRLGEFWSERHRKRIRRLSF